MKEDALNYEKTRLPYYLVMDFWGADDACKLFADLDPYYAKEVLEGGERVFQIAPLLPGQSGTEEQGRRYLTYRKTWDSCDHTEWLNNERNPVKFGDDGERMLPVDYFLQWAYAKRIPIPWLEWADDNGYLDRSRQKLAFADANTIMLPINDPRISKQLIDMVQSAVARWGKWNPADKTTAPTNATVEGDLLKKGWKSPTMRKLAASIIRPENAPRGMSKKVTKKVQ
ncbi:hypothetical protein [Microbulbifer pacificus]|uniref:Uncharacterized protein n=1 Tax=Microbulbifer pacificus TaxID=407164 RepID=A0AAU0MY10_9GAMM|nr:hypothetical protein [Microbulbifer pacificus]WOX04709.1 hypothetical protein R5R33_13300 [Microbulbifer pacificus]